MGGSVHHCGDSQARHLQASQREGRSLHQRLEYSAATSLLFLKFQAIYTYYVLVSQISRSNKKYVLLIYFWEPSEPSGARTRMNTEVGSTLPSAKPSLPRGLLRGNPRTSPKSCQYFFEIFPFHFDLKILVSLEKTDARRKQLRYRAGRVVGLPTPPGYGTPLTTLRLHCL